MCSCKWPHRMIPGYFPRPLQTSATTIPFCQCIHYSQLVRTIQLLAPIRWELLARGFKMWGPLRNIFHQPWNTKHENILLDNVDNIISFVETKPRNLSIVQCNYFGVDCWISLFYPLYFSFYYISKRKEYVMTVCLRQMQAINILILTSAEACFGN